MLAVAFALGGTLTIEDGLERRAFVELLRSLSARSDLPFDEPRAQQFAEALFPTGRTEHHAEPNALVDAVSAFFHAPAPFVVVARFRQLAASRAPDIVRPAPDAALFLERIASLRVPSAILCNGWSTIAQCMGERTGFPGPMLVSEDIGAAKPSPEAFAALVAAIGLPADRIWYIGSDPRRDIQGATAAGLRAIWLNRDGAPYPADLDGHPRTIRNFEEILPEVCEEYTRSLLGLRYVLHTALGWRRGHFVPGVEYGLNGPENVPPFV